MTDIQKQVIADQAEWERGRKAAEAILDNVNGYSPEFLKGVTDTITGTHPTIQQGFMRNVVVPVIHQWHLRYTRGTYDERNAATCRACHDLDNVLGKEGFPFI